MIVPLLVAAVAAAPALPDRVHLKSRTLGITSRHYVALEGGKLWFKANEETTGTDDEWQLLPPDGLPRGPGKRGFPPPTSPLVALSADGDNLVVLAEDGQVFYMKWSTRKWVLEWGLPPTKELLFAKHSWRSMAMSHRGPDNLYYEDIDGKRHEISAGVTTFFSLTGDGREIVYADPWLPRGFGHYVCPPRRGRFTAEALDASASTLFAIDAAGEMWTRLADFDVVGDNPVLPYSYLPSKKARTRRLPGEDWRRQPAIAGKHTTRITLLQTGQGNAARELRVEGADAGGKGGYWRKGLADEAWTFVPTGETVTGPFVDPSRPEAERLGPSLEHALRGTVHRGKAKLGAALEELHPRCTPAVLTLARGAESLRLELHLRQPRIARKKEAVVWTATVLRPADAPKGSLAADLFGKKPVLEGTLLVSDGSTSASLQLPGITGSFGP